MNRRRRILLLLCGASAAACAPAPPTAPVAVDHCALQEYLEECEFDTGPEQAQCFARAPQEATRIASGIPQECREPRT